MQSGSSPRFNYSTLCYVCCCLSVCKPFIPTVALILPASVSCVLFSQFDFWQLNTPRASVSQQLLAVVQQKAMVGVLDSTLKFALSALWNLTDEMPTAARNFIECQGLELYEEVLEVQKHSSRHV